METIINALFMLHVAAGFASLLLFWVPVFTRKGGVNHRRTGKLYVQLMWIVVITAALLCIKNFLTGKVILGVFLGYLSLITANPLWHGIAILKHKNGFQKGIERKHLVFRVVIALAGCMLIIYGVLLKGNNAAILMFVFGGLGLTEIPAILRSIKCPVQEAGRLKNHLVSMCVSGIAAYTAFFVFGANQLFNYSLQGYWAIIPWVAPTVFGVTGINYGVYHFRKRGLIK